METLFENRYIKNREWAKDVFGYINFRRPLIIVFDIYFFLYIVIGIIDIIVDKNIDVYSFILPIVWIFLQVFIYVKNVNVTLKRDLEIHGKPIEVAVIVTDEKITTVQSTGSEIHLNYADVKKAFQTKKYIYLQTKTNLLCSFKKDGFSFGNKEDFLEFLRNKGIKIK
ncbi:MAG: YcxB family protein [Clostridia bacterium]|nr:YcxB family protein [Clostridia bacterium]